MKAVKTKLVLLVLCFMVFGQKAGAQCSFSIKASVTKICEKEVVEFSIINAPSASSIKEINWDFGFKQVKNNNNPIVIYNSKGVYDVVLTVKTSTSCTVTESKLITVNELPDMGKVASSKKEACAPGSRVQFSSTSVNAYKWHWVVESEYYTGKNANINHKMENEGWPYVQLTVESVEGCKNKFIFDSLVHVLSKPVVDFDKTELLLCELPGTLKVKPKIDYKGTTIKSHAWDFEGATVSVDYKKNPSDKYYVKAGQYDVNLELISAKGCRFEYEFKDTVDVIDIAKSNIVARSLTKSGCPSMRYKVVVGGIDTSLFKWDYPKNDVLWVDSTQKDSTVFYFKNEGTHTVKVVINQGPCKSVYPLKLKAAIGLVKADFAAPKCLCDPQSIFKAKNKSVGNGKLSYEWLINSENGLKITSTDSNLSKVIGIPGKYNVFLKATHKNGCYDYEGRILRIKKNEVTADHIRDEACMVDNFTLPLDSFCNVDTNKLYWFFYNENKKLVWQDTGISVRVEFPDTGYYSVAVVVNSTTGCSDSAYFQKHIYVKDCFGDISASFSYVEGCAGKIVMPLLTETISQFKVNAVLVLQSDTTVTYSGTFKFPFLNFIVQKAGIYNLKVRVSSKDGSIYKDYYEKSIVYVNKLTIQGEIGKSWGCFPEKHTELKTTLIKNELFYGTDSSVDLRWRIYPHDKGYINNDTARNTYSVVYEQGQVDIELKAENRTGCKAKWQSVNKLNENLKVEFFMPENACFGDTIFMNNQSTGPIQKWEWSSDNSNDLFLPNSAIKKPEFKAKAEGKRTIELTVIDTNGCVSSISKEINLVDIELDFTVEDTTAKCSPATYFFQAKGKKVQQFEWDFGDGDQLKTKKTKKIPKIYDLRRINPYQNTFTVTLTGSHSSGCTQKVVKPNLIKIKGPWPKFEISNIKGCSPLKVSFTDKSENVHKLYFDYGDRTSVDTVLNAEHIYKADTTKEVEYFKPYIVAHDKFDCRTAYFLDDTVKVFSMPVARFIGSPRTGCEPLTTKLRSNS
ncbi:MAG: PKD domain-containing protein, partial [Bacteroidia bacterium]